MPAEEPTGDPATWNKDELQLWLATYKGSKWREHVQAFKGLSGSEVLLLDKPEVQLRVGGPRRTGTALYDTLHNLHATYLLDSTLGSLRCWRQAAVPSRPTRCSFRVALLTCCAPQTPALSRLQTWGTRVRRLGCTTCHSPLFHLLGRLSQPYSWDSCAVRIPGVARWHGATRPRVRACVGVGWVGSE